MHFHSLLPVVGLALLQGCSAASILRRSPVVSNNLPAGYNYLGCYTDSPQNRQLTGASYTDGSGMTEESCISFCSSKGFQEAGLEYGQECYCGHQFESQPVQASDSDCNMPCSGDASEVCGAANRMSVFSNGKAAPVTNPGTDGWTLLGCYSDSPSARTLSTSVNAGGSSGLSVSSCVSTCQAAGYSYAGVEYGDECYCDTAIRNGATIQSSGCDTTCSGNSSEYCGGAFRIDVYRLFGAASSNPAPIPQGWTSLGCYNDNTSARTLNTPTSVSGGSSNVTIEGCLSACGQSGFSYAGLEYGQECYCDNRIENGATPASDSSACHYPCSGNKAETCGGSSVLNLYSYSQSGTVTSTTTVATSTSVSTSSSSLTSTTTSSCTPTSTPASPYLSNGGFEQGLSGWSTQAYQGTFDASVHSDGLSYRGCSEFSVIPTSSQSSNRQLSLSTTINNLRPSASYTVSLAIGRPTSQVSTHQAPYVAIVAGSRQVGGGYICGFANTGACPTQGNGGSVYLVISAPFAAQNPSQQLGVVLSWIGSDVLNEVVLVDEFTVTAS